MLTRLTSNQITEYWPIIEKSLSPALEPSVLAKTKTKNRILKALLVGKLVCWFAHDVVKDKRYARAVIITSIVPEDILDSASLLIYSLTAFVKLSADEWIEGFKSLEKYGKAAGCERILFYTDNEKLIRIAATFGGVCSYKRVTLEI